MQHLSWELQYSFTLCCIGLEALPFMLYQKYAAIFVLWVIAGWYSKLCGLRVATP